MSDPLKHSPAPAPALEEARRFEPLPSRSGSGATEALRLNEPALLASLLDAVPARVVVVDRELRYVYVNSESLNFLGLPTAQVVGRPAVEVIGAARMAAYQPIIERVLEGGESLQWEGWVDYPSRGPCYLREIIVPYRRDDGRVSHVLLFGRDLTEFKRQEQMLAQRLAALERAEALKSAIVDHALAAIVSTDLRGRVVEFNPAAEAMFGLPRARALGRSITELMIPPRHRAAHEAGMARLTAGEPPRLLGQRLEMHALRADGSEFPVEMVLWRTDVGGDTYYTASINDMSERQRAAEVIDRQRDALRQSEKLSAMGSLLAGVAHELNNPLSIVLGRASLLEEKSVGSPLAEDALRIHEAAQRCGRIVRTFLNMARQRPARREPVQLNDIARAAAEMLGYTLRSHDIALSLALARELPEVPADRDQIGQVVLNLIVNAQQALAEHPGPRRIELATGVTAAAAGHEPQVWLSVSDSGPGVPPPLQQSIFEPFFTTKSEGSGTGLGLSVSRSLVREHGGELQLLAGSGACFRLSLPIAGPAQPPEAVAAPSAPQPLRQARVLVVDDEPGILDLVRAILETAGHEVATAESGALALALLDEARFDAVVCDLRMPDMDGAALWRAIRARDPRLAQRMLFVTGDTLSPAARSFLSDSACAALDKPFAKSELLERVQALLNATPR